VVPSMNIGCTTGPGGTPNHTPPTARLGVSEPGPPSQTQSGQNGLPCALVYHIPG
jgi:hypothetical protein